MKSGVSLTDFFLIGAIVYYLEKLERLLVVCLRTTIYVRQIWNLIKKNEGQEEEGVTTNQDLGDGRNENTNPVILRKSTRARKPPQRYMHD